MGKQNMLCEDISKSIGNTPLIRLARFGQDCGAEMVAKLESANPLSSVKDRIAIAMIESGEAEGHLLPGTTVIEPTSGNTGIGLAFVCARRGYELLLTMPETMSRERRKLLQHLGARLVLTPGSEGMTGAVRRARELLQETENGWMPDQFANPANPAIHYRTTGPEIYRQCAGWVDCFVAGIGTGGTITGVGRFLKEKNQGVRIIGVEPAASAVLSGGEPGPHKIQGIGAGFIPRILDRTILDEVITISNEDALGTARVLARQEGIFCGISSGAAVAAARIVARRPENRGKRIVVVLPDTGERYLSTELIAGLEERQGE